MSREAGPNVGEEGRAISSPPASCPRPRSSSLTVAASWFAARARRRVALRGVLVCSGVERGACTGSARCRPGEAAVARRGRRSPSCSSEEGQPRLRRPVRRPRLPPRPRATRRRAAAAAVGNQRSRLRDDGRRHGRRRGRLDRWSRLGRLRHDGRRHDDGPQRDRGLGRRRGPCRRVADCVRPGREILSSSVRSRGQRRGDPAAATVRPRCSGARAPRRRPAPLDRPDAHTRHLPGGSTEATTRRLPTRNASRPRGRARCRSRAGRRQYGHRSGSSHGAAIVPPIRPNEKVGARALA